MPPLLKKKKPEAASGPTMPPWHPDLRNPARLPDTKVVRTAFFVNGIAILAVVVLALWCSYQAYELRELNRQIAGWEHQIERDRPASTQSVALYRKFQADAARVNEVDAFVKSRPAVSAVLMHIAATLPAYLALDRFDLRDTTATLRGTVRGSPDQASGFASSYLEQLIADPFFAENFREIKLVGLTRSPQTGRLVVEITMKVKEPKKP